MSGIASDAGVVRCSVDSSSHPGPTGSHHAKPHTCIFMSTAVRAIGFTFLMYTASATDGDDFRSGTKTVAREMSFGPLVC